MLKRLGLLLPLLLSLTAPTATAQIYVDIDASGANDGTSWTDAYTNLQDALSAAPADEEIWIAEGVYTPDPDGTDETISFTITGAKDGLQLYGGFDGTESQRSGRNPSQHVTVLSGDIGGDDNTNADGVTETADGINGDNSHHVLVLDGGNRLGSNVAPNVTDGTVVDGITVTGGQADDGSSDNTDFSGGGLFCDGAGTGNACNPTISGVVFAGNRALYAGGGLHNDGFDGGTASPVLTGVTFTGNVTQYWGGALHNKGYSGTASPTITGAVFAGNETRGSTGGGGAMYNDGSENGTARPEITNAVFVENETSQNGGAILNGGTYNGDVAALSLTNVTLVGNTAGEDGGAIYSLNPSDAPTRYVNTIFWGNSAANGDQIFNDYEATPKFTHTIVEGGTSGISENDGSASIFLDETGNSVSFANSTNLDQNPQFAGGPTAAGADGVFGTEDDSLNVELLSPAVDAGTNDSVTVATALTGAARIQDTDGNGTATVNLGAYEAAVGPDAATNAPSSVAGRSVDLSGTVGLNGASTTVTFEYRRTGASTFQSIEAAESPLTAAGHHAVTASPGGLTPGTEYEARIVATNSDGSAQGELVTFTTDSPVPPLASTSTPGTVRSRDAELAGTVKPGDASTSVRFEYRETGASSFQSVTANESPLSGTGGTPVSAAVEGLAPGTEYEARVVASNSAGTDTGSLATFTTAPITYVDADATGTDDGTSWTDAYTNLQDALSAATAGEEIWIAEGVYTPDPGGTDQTKSFTITGAKDGLQLYGGFDGTETSRAQRDPSQHVTILSGDLGGDDKTNADGVTETADGINGDNSHHVLVLDGGNRLGSNVAPNVTDGTVVDGITVTGGQADGDHTRGGGLFCDGAGTGNGCSPTISGVVFAGNRALYAGGGLHNDGFDGGTASPVLTGVTFTGNVAQYWGGALQNKGYSGTASPTITGAVFAGNETRGFIGGGGAMYNDGAKDGTASPAITNAVFVENETSQDGGAIYSSITPGNGTARLTLTGVTLAGNTAGEDGGAIFSEYVDGFSQYTNTIFWGNTAGGSGDQVYNRYDETTPHFTHTIVEGGPAGIAGNGGSASVFLDETGNSVSFANSTNLDQNPQFAGGPSAAGEDGVFATKDDSLNLSAGSPALDAGTNDSVTVATDLTGGARIQDRDDSGTATVNIGAYEAAPGSAVPQVTSVSPSTPPPGQPVILSGNDLGGTGSVTYGETSVPFTVASDTEVRARVPVGATSGAAFIASAGGGSASSSEVSLGATPYGAGQALALDGNGDSVKGPSMNLSGSALTLEAWIRPDQFPNASHAIAGIDGSGTALLRVGGPSVAADVLQLALEIGGSTVTVSANGGLATGEWQHVAGVYDGSEMRLYVDGTLVGSTSQSGTFTANDVFRAGRSGNGHSFFGQMDQVRVWTRALSASAVRARAHRQVATDAAGLEAVYRFDAAGSRAYDHSTAFRHGTLEGDPQRVVSGARLGTESVAVSSGSGSVGRPGAAVAVQNATGPLQVYRAGDANAPARTGDNPGENFSQVPSVTRRLGVTWGLSASGSADADVTLQYSGLAGAQSGARKVVLKRDGPGQPWTAVTSQFNHDPQAKTFSAPGVSDFSEYAIGLSRALQVDGDPGPGDPSDRGWRFVGVPTASPLPAGDLRLNGTAPRFDLPSGHMLHRWDDDRDGGPPTGGYVPIETASEPLQPGRGVALFLFDEAPHVLDPSMTIDVANDPTLMGDDPVTVSGLSQTARWHLLANPYPSGYDLSSLTDLTENGFQAQVQRYDATSGTWVLETQAKAQLSIWQAFFVERTDYSGGAGATALTFDPAGRQTGAPFIGTQSPTSSPRPAQEARLALSLSVAGDGTDILSTDAAAQVVFRTEASENWDAYDATKLAPLANTYALLAPMGSGRADSLIGKAVESRPWPTGPNTDRKEIPLRLAAEGLSGETATISVQRWQLLTGWRARIVDTQTGSSQPLTADASYTVELPDDSVRATPRYELQVAPTGTELPVELAGFEATSQENGVRLQWQTASETGNARFEVQRKASGPNDSAPPPGDGADWTTIGTRPGAGTTTAAQTYRFTDREVPYAADTLTYRLRQVDTDGTAHVTDPVTVARRAPTEIELKGAFPNPARTRATIRYALPEGLSSKTVRLVLYDVLGRRVRTIEDGPQRPGRRQLQLDTSRLASGTYFYRFSVDGAPAKTRKLTVVR